MFEIERGVPIPPLGKSNGRKRKYPFRDIEVGESFFVPYENGVDKMDTQAAIRQALGAGAVLPFGDLAKVIGSMDIPGKPASYVNLKNRIGVVLQSMKAKKAVENTPEGWRLI